MNHIIALHVRKRETVITLEQISKEQIEGANDQEVKDIKRFKTNAVKIAIDLRDAEGE